MSLDQKVTGRETDRHNELAEIKDRLDKVERLIKDLYMSTHVSEIKEYPETVKRCWYYGQLLVTPFTKGSGKRS